MKRSYTASFKLKDFSIAEKDCKHFAAKMSKVDKKNVQELCSLFIKVLGL